MEIKIEINSYDELKEMSWCNEENFNKIERYNLEDEYFDYVEMLMEGAGETPTDTQVNDFMRFDDGLESWIAEHLNFGYADNIEELQEIASDLYSDAEDTINEAINTNKGEKLWNYLQEQFLGVDSLQEVFEFIEDNIDLEEDLNEEEE